MAEEKKYPVLKNVGPFVIGDTVSEADVTKTGGTLKDWQDVGAVGEANAAPPPPQFGRPTIKKAPPTPRPGPAHKP